MLILAARAAGIKLSLAQQIYIYASRFKILHWFHRLERWNQYINSFISWKIHPKRDSV